MNTSRDKDDIRLEVKTEVREEPWGRYVLIGVEATFLGMIDANDDIDDPIQRAILRGLDRIVVEVEKARLERTPGATHEGTTADDDLPRMGEIHEGSTLLSDHRMGDVVPGTPCFEMPAQSWEAIQAALATNQTWENDDGDRAFIGPQGSGQTRHISTIVEGDANNYAAPEIDIAMYLAAGRFRLVATAQPPWRRSPEVEGSTS